MRIEPIGECLGPPAHSLNEIQELPVVAKTVDLEPHGREPVFDAPAILAERINFDRAVRAQHTEQTLHGIGHGFSPSSCCRMLVDGPGSGGSGLSILPDGLTVLS